MFVAGLDVDFVLAGVVSEESVGWVALNSV